MDTLGKLTELFRQFPGIGPRQARRFAYFVSTKNNAFVLELKETIEEARKSVHSCFQCFRIHFDKKSKLCPICNDENRDKETLMILSRDIDLESMEKSGAYSGLYFILGGLVPIMSSKFETYIRIKELLNYIKNNELSDKKIKEIIIALSTTPEGENTTEIVKEEIKTEVQKQNIKVSLLGRGLSTGAEIEYADSHTIKDALNNRH